MFDSSALEVVIGLTFVYLLYSLLGTLLQEIIATNICLRAKILRKAIRRMLDDGKTDRSVSDTFYGHPLIKYLATDNWWPMSKLPAYMSHDTFSKVVIDLLRGTDLNAGDAYNTIIQKSLNDKKLAWGVGNTTICPQTLTYLKSMWIDAQGDVQKFEIYLEKWFDEMMDRTTGWYKRWTQIILFGVGLGIACAFNVDTIQIITKLENNPTLRAQIVSQANDFTKAHPDLGKTLADTNLVKVRDSLYHQSAELLKQGGDASKLNSSLGLAWNHGFLCRDDMNGTTWLGWILTALAISLGAPFWFDLLNKLMQMRSSTDSSKNKKVAGTKVKPGTVPATERVG